MAVTVKNLANGQLPLVKTTLYTVPALTAAIVMDISLVNTNAGNVDCNIYYKKAAGTSRRVVPQDLRLKAKEHYQRKCRITMGAGDEIEGEATVAVVVDYVLSGIEQA